MTPAGFDNWLEELLSHVLIGALDRCLAQPPPQLEPDPDPQPEPQLGLAALERLGLDAVERLSLAADRADAIVERLARCAAEPDERAGPLWWPARRTPERPQA